MYTAENDTIYLPPNGFNFSPKIQLTSVEQYLFLLGLINNVKDIIDHELGHFYIDKLNESLGKGNFEIDDTSKEDIIRTKLLSEGVAVYFDKTINGGKDNFKDSDWPKETEDFLKRKTHYDGGFHFVKPIIDAYGKKGIEYLICNPPTKEDLKDLSEYRQRALQELESKKLH